MVRWRRRRSESTPSIDPAALEHTLGARIAWWSLLDGDERRRVVELTEAFVGRVRWEAARGFVLTDEVRMMIAAQAALMLLGLDDDRALDNVGSVIVHRSTVTSRGERAIGGGVVSGDPMLLAGQASHRGPVVISWRAAQQDLRRVGTGHNVVVHELAHKLDLLDEVLDGTPPLPDDDVRRRWVEVCEAELARLQHGEAGPLRAYGATNPAEFFAVASEVFFDRPAVLEEQRPALYDVLRAFYGQDPAERERRYWSGVRSAAATSGSDTGR